jgi:hypothetical protein
MLLRRVAVGQEGVQAIMVAIGDAKGDACAHGSQTRSMRKYVKPNGTLLTRTIH